MEPPEMRRTVSGIWTQYGYIASCNSPIRLFCLQIDQYAPLELPRVPGKRIFFVSDSKTDPSHGIASFDAVCAGDAAAASLPGSYKALVAQAGQSANARFTAQGVKVFRPDGVQLATTDTALLEKSELLAAPDVGAAGASYDNWGIWIGAKSLTDVPDYMCNNWSSNAPYDYAHIGGCGFSTSAAFSDPYALPGCNSEFRVYCLQE
jgi:hypothetical protein